MLSRSKSEKSGGATSDGESRSSISPDDEIAGRLSRCESC